LTKITSKMTISLGHLKVTCASFLTTDIRI